MGLSTKLLNIVSKSRPADSSGFSSSRIFLAGSGTGMLRFATSSGMVMAALLLSKALTAFISFSHSAKSTSSSSTVAPGVALSTAPDFRLAPPGVGLKNYLSKFNSHRNHRWQKLLLISSKFNIFKFVQTNRVQIEKG